MVEVEVKVGVAMKVVADGEEEAVVDTAGEGVGVALGEGREEVILEEGGGVMSGNVKNKRLKNPRRRPRKVIRMQKRKLMTSRKRLLPLLMVLRNKEEVKSMGIFKTRKVTNPQMLLMLHTNLLLLFKTRLPVRSVDCSIIQLGNVEECCVKSVDSTIILPMTVEGAFFGTLDLNCVLPRQKTNVFSSLKSVLTQG